MIWADSGTQEYSTRFLILFDVCLVQDLGKERVEDKVIGEDEEGAVVEDDEAM